MQDSAWLSRLDVPRHRVDVAIKGEPGARVESVLPGIACPPGCGVEWDVGTEVVLRATQPDRSETRFLG